MLKFKEDCVPELHFKKKRFETGSSNTAVEPKSSIVSNKLENAQKKAKTKKFERRDP